MGRAVANATNAAQGWRGGGGTNPEPKPKETITMKKSGMDRKKCDYPTGNSHRAKNDDGSRQSRNRAGGQSTKHRSPHTHG